MALVFTIIKLIIVLSVVATIHEFGHFLFAKLFKMTVNEFSIGFGPKIFSKEYKGTKYSLRWILFGGYVAIEGEEGESEDENAFAKKPCWQRIIVLVAGVLFNVILATVLFLGTNMVSPTFGTKISGIYEDGAAYVAGLRQGDIITKIDDKDTHIYQDVASIYVVKDEAEQVSVQVIGDEYVYGANYIIEPIYIRRPLIYDWFWGTTWYAWTSPWYWGYYPSWWYAHNCWAHDWYWHHCYAFHHHHHWCSFRPGHHVHHGWHELHSGVTRRDYAVAHPHRSFSQRNSGMRNARDIRSTSSVRTRQAVAANTATHSTASRTFGSQNTVASRSQSVARKDQSTAQRTSATTQRTATAQRTSTATTQRTSATTAQRTSTATTQRTATAQRTSAPQRTSAASTQRTTSTRSSSTYTPQRTPSSSRSSVGTYSGGSRSTGGGYSGGGRSSGGSYSGGGRSRGGSGGARR